MKAEETQARDDGGPAFPVPCSAGPLGAITWGEGGMSLRDYFAAKASENDVQEYITGPVTEQVVAAGTRRRVVHEPSRRTREQAKYAYADAMLAARKK